ncbi:MAG: hypothetical protein N2257_05720 [Thermodesulfovibrionales bacterium]|nr:hypothetical protein [Thermodesulfovibrionales bacterium]
MTINGTYKLSITHDNVTFYTFFYKAEKGSILHSALMSRETTSLIVASFVDGALFSIYAMYFPVRIFEIIAFILLFGLLFIFFRLSIFRERPLEVSFFRNMIKIKYPAFIIKKVENFSLNQVKYFAVNKKILSVDNPEGAEIVKKIALQHGTIIPDFAESIEVYYLELGFHDGNKKIIYVDRDGRRINNLYGELKRWLSLAGIREAERLFITHNTEP